MDISDILASVSAPALPQRALDLQALTRAWINERSCPELLPYPQDLIQRSTEGVQQQIERIENLTGAMDPSANFTLVILQTELERVKFLLRSFLRARIAKVCCSLHTLVLGREDSDADSKDRSINSLYITAPSTPPLQPQNKRSSRPLNPNTSTPTRPSYPHIIHLPSSPSFPNLCKISTIQVVGSV